MVIEFECRKCGLIVSHKEGNRNRYCRNCGTFLYLRSSLTGISKYKNIKSNDPSKNLVFNSLMINLKEGREIALSLFEKFNSNDGIFGHNIMPEDFVPRWGSNLEDLKINRGSYEHLLFITMVVSIDYQRDADKLWKAGRKTFETRETRWLFFPEELNKKSFPDIVNAMKRFKLSKKPTKDAEIWSNVSNSFFKYYDSNPKKLIENSNFNAMNLFQQKFDPKFKKRFPYFSGNKIFPLWIRMLNDNLDIELENIDQVPIPVDVHIARATLSTQCLTGRYSGSISQIAPMIDNAWEKIMDTITDDKLKYRLQLDEPLWHLSRYGCKHRRESYCPKKSKCPIGDLCSRGSVKVSTKGIELDTNTGTGEKKLNHFTSGN